MTRDEARAAFEPIGYKYIKRAHLHQLMSFLEIELDKYSYHSDFDEFKMELLLPKEKELSFDKDGSLISAFFFVKGKIIPKADGSKPFVHFKTRECISFNRSDNFIGFCGWADGKNSKPIIDAFAKWVESLKEQKEKEESLNVAQLEN